MAKHKNYIIFSISVIVVEMWIIFPTLLCKRSFLWNENLKKLCFYLKHCPVNGVLVLHCPVTHLTAEMLALSQDGDLWINHCFSVTVNLYSFYLLMNMCRKQDINQRYKAHLNYTLHIYSNCNFCSCCHCLTQEHMVCFPLRVFQAAYLCKYVCAYPNSSTQLMLPILPESCDTVSQHFPPSPTGEVWSLWRKQKIKVYSEFTQQNCDCDLSLGDFCRFKGCHGTRPRATWGGFPGLIGSEAASTGTSRD